MSTAVGAEGPLKSVAVFCGSAAGDHPVFLEAARATGAALARRGVAIVYGGGQVGMMGAVADSALAAGGTVIGVIPERLADLELAHHGCTRLEVVPDMHARKARMAALADGFVALPGGWGTWEEVFEAMTWTQLGYHDKPVGILDVDGYHAPLKALLEGAVTRGFVREDVSAIVSWAHDADTLLDRMEAARWPPLPQWLHAV